jgi:head-tail adaptor
MSARAGGKFRRRVTFQQRPVDANGDVGEWADIVTCPAEIKPLTGGEEVKAARIEGRQPAVIIVDRTSVTIEIDNGWRVYDARRTSTIWDISSVFWNEADNTMEILAIDKKGGVSG